MQPGDIHSCGDGGSSSARDAATAQRLSRPRAVAWGLAALAGAAMMAGAAPEAAAQESISGRTQTPDPATAAERGGAGEATPAPGAAATTTALANEDEIGPHTLFFGSVQLLSMPATQMCPAIDRNELACTPGEAALGFGLAALGRWRNFGFGGGFTWGFGLRPTTVAGGDDAALLRKHGRSYLVIEGLFHYYLPPIGAWNWWVGAGAGGLVVSDTFSTDADRNPYTDTSYVGPRSVTLRSEGAALSLGIGGHWRFYEQLMIGTQLRYANWLLPADRERTPLGDSASLAGRIDVIDAGVVVGALLPL